MALFVFLLLIEIKSIFLKIRKKAKVSYEQQKTQYVAIHNFTCTNSLPTTSFFCLFLFGPFLCLNISLNHKIVFCERGQHCFRLNIDTYTDND